MLVCSPLFLSYVTVDWKSHWNMKGLARFVWVYLTENDCNSVAYLLACFSYVVVEWKNNFGCERDWQDSFGFTELNMVALVGLKRRLCMFAVLCFSYVIVDWKSHWDMNGICKIRLGLLN